MNINRFNYEEFFLLYVDNELSVAERKQVEAFVAQHPDLEEELMMLTQSQLKPDTSIILEDKSSLFKSEKHTLINPENYETFFLLYVDEELSTEERRAVELFASQHPAQQQELEILMQTRITPEASVVFPDKTSLYKKVGTERVVSMKVWRIVAVAAMLILAVGILWLNSEKKTNTEYAKSGTTEKDNQKKDQTIAKDNGSSKETADGQTISKEEENGIAIAQVQNRKEQGKNNRQYKDVVVSTPQTTDHSKDGSNPTKIEEKNIEGKLLARTELETDVPAATNLDTKVLVVDQAYAQAQQKEDVVLTAAEDTPSDEIAVGPVQTKNRIRGIFRQVARVVEKNTHVSAAENKKLRIGNIQIALK